MTSDSCTNEITPRFSNDASSNVLSVEYSTDIGSTYTTYYYLRNAQGDIVKLIDKAGSTVVEYKYDTWVKQLSCTGSLSTTLGTHHPFRYRSYVYDMETGWYYLQSRYYNPEVGRFISADVYLSTGQGVLGNNSYAYCLNNPVNAEDESGNKPTGISPPIYPPLIPLLTEEVKNRINVLLCVQIAIQDCTDDVKKFIKCAINVMDSKNKEEVYKFGVWDCSGYVNTVLWNFFPKSIKEGKGICGGTVVQRYLGEELGWEYSKDMSQMQSGDLVYWWAINKENDENHVAIYIGYGLIIDNSPGRNVSIHYLKDYDTSRFDMEWLRPVY